MAYTPSTLIKAGPGIVTGVPAPNWTYKNLTDTLATISASGYLDASFQSPDNLAGSLQINDLIYLEGSDGSDWVKILTLNPITVDTNVEGISLTNGDIFIGNASNQAAVQTMSGDVTIAVNGVTTLSNGSVSLENLDAGITSSHIIFAAGKEAFGGGSTITTVPVPGVSGTDIGFAVIEAATTPTSVVRADPGLIVGTMTVEFAVDPGAATSISWQVLRAAT